MSWRTLKFLKIQGPRNDYKDKGTLAGPAYGILNEATALASDHIVKRQIENALISPKKVPLSREEIYAKRGKFLSMSPPMKRKPGHAWGTIWLTTSWPILNRMPWSMSKGSSAQTLSTAR